MPAVALSIPARVPDAEVADWQRVLGRGCVRDLESVRVENFQSGRALQRQASNDVSRNIADQSHSSVPSSPEQHATERDQMRPQTSPRNFRVVESPEFPIDRMTKDEFRQSVVEAINSEFQNGESKTKIIAEKGDVTAATVNHWMEKGNAPNAYSLIRMAAHFPKLRAEIQRMWALEADLDPEAERLVNELVMRMVRGK